MGVRDVESDALGHELPAGHADDAAGSLGTRRRKVLSLGNGAPRRNPGEPPPHMRVHGEPPGFSEGHICISAKQAEAAGAHSRRLTAVPAWTTLLGDPAAFGSDFTALISNRNNLGQGLLPQGRTGARAEALQALATWAE